MTKRGGGPVFGRGSRDLSAVEKVDALALLEKRDGKSIAREAQGRKARAGGEKLEEHFEEMHRLLYADRLVLARGHPETHVVAGRGGQPRVVYTGKGSVDFVGFMSDGAWRIPVAFDLKRRSGESHYRHDERRLAELEFLMRWEVAGGAAFILVVDDVVGIAYALHGSAFRDLAARESVRLSSPGAGADRTPVWPVYVRRGANGWYDWPTLLASWTYLGNPSPVRRSDG